MAHSPFQPQNLSSNLVQNQPFQLPPSNPALCQIIAQRIAAAPDQRIPFTEFMDLALYQPQLGYYATNRDRAGIQQDFFTSAHLGQDFGELLAEQFVEMWHHLGQPQPFTLVELGAGQGLLVPDILRYLHRHHFSCFAALDYWIVETSAGLIAAQQQRLQALQSWGRLSWRSWDEIEPDSIVGCCFSNELVDAFPVHQVIVQNGELREVYVGLANPAQTDPADSQSVQFQEVIGPLSTPRLAKYFEQVGINLLAPPYPEGYRTEVNLAALDWLTTVAAKLQRGYLLTIDYGYKAERYYRPNRSQGTLQCYYQHRHHSDPFAAIGLQDITTHVDFTALERQGHHLGLQSLDLTQQGLFLMALGMGDRIAALSHPEPSTQVQEILQRRESLHALIDPAGLGNFGVLVQGKGLTAAQLQLKGLTLPPFG